MTMTVLSSVLDKIFQVETTFWYMKMKTNPLSYRRLIENI